MLGREKLTHQTTITLSGSSSKYRQSTHSSKNTEQVVPVPNVGSDSTFCTHAVDERFLVLTREVGVGYSKLDSLHFLQDFANKPDAALLVLCHITQLCVDVPNFYQGTHMLSDG
jgi:hypothetical protein